MKNFQNLISLMREEFERDFEAAMLNGDIETFKSIITNERHSIKLIESLICKRDMEAMSRLISLIAKFDVTKGIDSTINVIGVIGNYEYSYTLLQIAAKLNELEIVKFLLTDGANPNSISHHRGKTALHYAAQNNNMDMVKCLVNADADINAYCNPNEILMLIILQRFIML
ncbi:MAG: ankyrin repeat domain-containing protein [Gammaproteobacteria bacterium]|nr:ankyrin repeat domain-containing protein [Gammaproteobacteria bacterium]